MPEKWERMPLTPEEIAQTINAAETLEERMVITFLADTGCRVNELIRMRARWFDFDVGKYGVVDVPPKTDANGVRGAKTKKTKHIPLTKRLSSIVSDWGADALYSYGTTRDQASVYRSPVWVYSVCIRCAKRAGIEKRVTPHVFRHSYARNAFYYGKLKPLEIAALLGHRDAKMVEQVYLKIDDGITAKRLEASGWLD